MNNHKDLTVTQTMNYCKADVKTGKPLVITSLDGTRKNVKSWKMDLFDKDGLPVRLRCVFGKPNRHGVRAALEVLR